MKTHVSVSKKIVWCLAVIGCYSIDLVITESQSHYLVNTEKCKMPDYPPFNDDTIKLWRIPFSKSCTSMPLLTYTKKSDLVATLHVKEYLRPLYGSNVTCCVTSIFREPTGDWPDDNIRFSDCEYFQENIVLKSDTTRVRCQNGQGIVVYENVHATILRKPEIDAKMKKIPSTMKAASVLFVVLDSVSRLNLIRTMPKTREYLLENDFIEMEGYNKINDNTLPNILALLTGLNAGQYMKKNCVRRDLNVSDSDCPMLWYTFRDLGYATAYGEDWGRLATFNDGKKGFTKPPTDYYFRPYVLASETTGMSYLYGAPYCAGPETSGERQLNLASDFAQTFKGSPYFGIFWMNTFSHQHLNTPLLFDDKLYKFFAELKASGVLDDSIVVFLSDHGIRMFPMIRKTIPGWFEERLPMNLISIPKWFQEKFPTEYANLKVNSKKLTSTYDMYMTLQHILKLSLPNYKVSPSEACPNCVSLFDEISTRRCSEAGIPAVWCTCVGYLKPMNTSDVIVTRGVEFTINYMKSELIAGEIAHLCEDLELLYVNTAGLSEFGNLHYLFLNFLNKPYGDFMVTLSFKPNSYGPVMFNFMSEVHRLDRRWNTCTSNYNKISQYCICKVPVDTNKNETN